MLITRQGAPLRPLQSQSICWSCALRQKGANTYTVASSSQLAYRHTVEEKERKTLSTSHESVALEAVISYSPPENAAKTRSRRERHSRSASIRTDPSKTGASLKSRSLSTTTRGSRTYHTTSRKLQVEGAARIRYSSTPDPIVFGKHIGANLDDNGSSERPSQIREQLRLWNDKYGADHAQDLVDDPDDADLNQGINNITRLGDVDDFRRSLEVQQDDRAELSELAQTSIEDLDTLDPGHRFLRKGDLVELEFPRSERDSIVAVFVRRVGSNQSQFYTINGKWIHLGEKMVQYAVPGWVTPEMVDLIVPYLPEGEVTEELLDRAQMFDLSVPRNISAPLVSRLLEFQTESEELYRKHAATLDNAHGILADPQVLKFGSLETITDKLLKKAPGQKTQSKAALFTVRKALLRAGFAFESDRRSHRLTGFIQIRSKEQVAGLEKTRNWVREWQEDMALKTVKGHTTGKSPRANEALTPGVIAVTSFVEKAKRLVKASRELRAPSEMGAIGPSKIRHEITKEQPATVATYTEKFSDSDRELIRFMESWACSNMFMGLPRVEALPPLILQATGMYPDFSLNTSAGFTFLQEIGVLLPYENRVRFDQHLLLPASQHSRPLEQLMSHVNLMGGEKYDPAFFQDSMKHLRRDWKDLPVFCIDSEGAVEIDDGLSVEQAGENEYWVHVHIANPSAFLKTDNPLAKLARHMTETIYMPERAYVMLPRWATGRHFGLGKNRPCLTFSARLNLDGDMLEHNITPGIVRNVHFVTPKQVEQFLGLTHERLTEVELVVGGAVPAMNPRGDGSGSSKSRSMSPANVEMLKVMQKLGKLRQERRRAGGGVFIDAHRPEMTVWNRLHMPGLPWDAPSRHNARFIEGDPVIQYRGHELSSWFASNEGVSGVLVQEMMLLACDVAGRWSSARNIPIIYRGTVVTPGTPDPSIFVNEVLNPATEKNGGEAPWHFAFEYLRNIGSTVLSTQPLHHRILGLGSYSKVTSPLRRYGDMVSHWQIEAALREEAVSGKSLVGVKKPRDFLPFSDASLKQMMTGLHPREGQIRRTMTYAEAFWSAQLFHRAHYFGECELPATYKAFVMSKPGGQMREVAIILSKYNLQCAMLRPDDGGFGMTAAELGDWWEVAIDKVDCFNRKVLMKPLRLISRYDN